MFEYTSSEFTNAKVMNDEKSKLVQEICNHFNLERSKFVLQRGSITLYGLSGSGTWLPITNHISDFEEKIRSKSFSSYRLGTRLVTLK